MSENDVLDGAQIEAMNLHSQKLGDEITKLGLKTKHYEDNLKQLRIQLDDIDESILDLEVGLERYNATVRGENNHIPSIEQHTLECIISQEKSAAGIICKLKRHHGLQASRLPVTKDVVGVVATLGKVGDDNLSRLLSEFLGLDTMMGIVCKTYEGVKALENYDMNGIIDTDAGLHGLGPSLGRSLVGRYSAFCLELLRPYAGEFLAEDSQKHLALLRPRLPNGECPPGFLGFAVNMISLEKKHLSFLTVGGHGLRETLFYNLFSRLQVYQTRDQMQLAMPCISDGAVSLDGGMIKGSGIFFLGGRMDVDVRFPVSTEIPRLPTPMVDLEEKLKLKNWEKERLVDDIRRENVVLSNVKELFRIKRQEYMDYLSHTRSYLSQLLLTDGIVCSNIWNNMYSAITCLTSTSGTSQRKWDISLLTLKKMN